MDKYQVYKLLTQIPKGKVTTYGDIAKKLGNKDLARYVGNVLHENPDGVKYPCYKVVNVRGKLSDAYAFGGKARQRELLKADGINVEGDKVDLKTYLWEI